MKKELAIAIRAELETRRAFNELPETATEEQLKEARAAHTTANAALEKLLKETEDAIEVPTELSTEVELRSYLQSYMRGHRVDGAQAELNKELGLDDETMVPLAAFLPEVEQRADVPTRTPDLPSNTNLHSVTARVFEGTLAGRLGISMPGVGAGQQDYPVLTGGTTAAPVAEGSQHDAAKATFVTTSINPKRITGRYVFSVEDIAKLGGQLETVLRNDLRTVLGRQVDFQVINGDGTGQNITGLLKTLNKPFAVNHSGNNAQKPTVTMAFTWQTLRDLILDGIDGVYAMDENAIRLAIGTPIYIAGRKLFNNNANIAADGIDALRALGSAVVASKRLVSAFQYTNTQSANAVSDVVQSAWIRTAEPSAAIAPVWNGVSVIRDPYTGAGKGEIALTMHTLIGFGLKRAAAWAADVRNISVTDQ